MYFRLALKRFYKVLKPGGQFGILLATKPEYFELYKFLGTNEKWAPYMQVRKNINVECCEMLERKY